jgi:hypothetical protein
MMLPGQGKSVEDLREDDRLCQLYAAHSVVEQSRAVAANSANADTAPNLMAGSLGGGIDRRSASQNPQRRYDASYTRCMYASGNTVQAVPPVHSGYPYGYVRYPSGWYGPPYGYGGTIIVDGGWGWGPGWYHHFSG